jgi:hypothetical protein
MAHSVRLHALALLGFAVLAALLTWPLPLHLGTQLTSPPGGDTGVYVWNLWVFRHEIEQGRLPFYTSSILTAAGGPANLSLHNYTTFANLLALPLTPLVGLIAAFNLILLVNMVLSGWCTFLLARHWVGRVAESWLAGAAVMASPVLIARADGHFSLVAAAPLSLFMLLLRLSATTGEIRYALGAGATVAWAIACDAYFGVFCVMLGAAALLAHLVDIRRADASPSLAVPVRRAVNVLLVVVASFVVGMALRGGGPVAVFGLRLRMNTLYTPVLVLSVLVAVRLMLALRPRFQLNREAWTGTVARSVFAGACVSAVMLSPVLYAFGERYFTDNAQMPPTYWRSSPSGIDLLAYLMPNPNHPLWGAPMRETLVAWSGRLDGFPEYVGALPWAALAIIAFGFWRGGLRLTGIRLPLTLMWVTLALGPFVHVAGFNTYIPTPWTFLRYVPIVSLVRSPSRFAVVVTIIVMVLFAMALGRITARYPERRRLILAVVALLAVELWPAPRALYSAEIPHFYTRIAADPRPNLRVLELPTGVRDGASSVGNFSAMSQFYQTAHGKALLGGYLSRVSPRRKRLYRQMPVLNALMTLSERAPLTPEQETRAREGVDSFLSRARLGYVVIDRAQASPELEAFARDLLGLRPLVSEGSRTLFAPRDVAWIDPPATPTPASVGGQ